MHYSSVEDGPYRSPALVATEPLPSWCGFVIGSLATLLLVYLGVVRPIRKEMTTVRYQIEAMQGGIEQLVALKPTAEATSDLVAQLSAQRHAFIEAHAAMQRIEALPQAIQQASIGLHESTDALHQLFDLKEAVLAMSDRLQQASDVLMRLEILSERLASASASVHRATQVGEGLVSLSQDLQQREEELESAKLTLAHVHDIQEQLRHEGTTMDESLERLQDLVLLKDLVLSRTAQMADAIETLELTVDLVGQFQQSARAFGKIRHWMVEVAATEPVMERARHSIEPLLEITQLRRLDPVQLRQLAREMNRQYSTAMAEETYQPQDGQTWTEENDIDWSSDEIANQPKSTESRQ